MRRSSEAPPDSAGRAPVSGSWSAKPASRAWPGPGVSTPYRPGTGQRNTSGAVTERRFRPNSSTVTSTALFTASRTLYCFGRCPRDCPGSAPSHLTSELERMFPHLARYSNFSNKVTITDTGLDVERSFDSMGSAWISKLTRGLQPSGACCSFSQGALLPGGGYGRRRGVGLAPRTWREPLLGGVRRLRIRRLCA